MKDQIKKIIEDLLGKMGFLNHEVSVSENESNMTVFSIDVHDSSILIGSRGENLKALNSIARRIVSAKPDLKDVRFLVDVGGYHEKKIEQIRYSAQITAERAKFLKESVEMDPMSPYERMIVHSTLQDDPEVTTESVGSGSARRVTVKFESGEESF